MLLIFPLFPGFHGYSSITAAKFAFFAGATLCWLAALAVGAAVQRPRLHWSGAAWAAAALAAVSIVSWLCSPWRAQALLGAGRYDGLVSQLLYIGIFLGVSATAQPRLLHARLLAAAVSLCLLVALGQILGYDPLHLFPAGLSYADRGLLYSGAYLGTIGNTNILDAVLCLALPVSTALYVLGQGALFLLPAALAAPVVALAGGDGALVAFLVCALAGAPLLLTEPGRIRRACRALALTAALAGLARMGVPEMAAAIVFAGLSLVRWPEGWSWRRVFLGLDAVLVLGALAAVWWWPGHSGTLYELRQVLHGQLEDGYGSYRIGIWRACLALAPERPLLGGGPGTLALRLELEFSRFVPETGQTLHTFVDNAHNVYLGALINTGALGLAALLATLGLCARTWLRQREVPLAAALGLGGCCAAVHGLFGLGLCLSQPLLWLVLGLVCAVARDGGTV